jgi:hypothetical protein
MAVSFFRGGAAAAAAAVREGGGGCHGRSSSGGHLSTEHSHGTFGAKMKHSFLLPNKIFWCEGLEWSTAKNQGKMRAIYLDGVQVLSI